MNFGWTRFIQQAEDMKELTNLAVWHPIYPFAHVLYRFGSRIKLSRLITSSKAVKTRLGRSDFLDPVRVSSNLLRASHTVAL